MFGALVSVRLEDDYLGLTGRSYLLGTIYSRRCRILGKL